MDKEKQRELLKDIIQSDEKDGLYDWDVTLNDGLNDIIEDIIDIIDSENSGQSSEQRLDSIKKYLKAFNTKEK